jgi:hypothetical protein
MGLLLSAERFWDELRQKTRRSSDLIVRHCFNLGYRGGVARAAENHLSTGYEHGTQEIWFKAYHLDLWLA